MARTALFVTAGTSVREAKEGDQVRAWNLADQLKRHGWDVLTLEKPGVVPDDGGDLDVTDVYSFSHALPGRVADVNPFYYRALYDLLTTHDVDLIHVKTFAGASAATVLTSLLGLDTVVVYDAQNVEAQKVDSLENPDLPKYKRVLAPILVPLLERSAVATVDMVVSVSDEDATQFRERYGIDGDRLTVVPSGGRSVDPDALEDRETVRRRHGIDPEATVVAFHGSYDYYPNEEAIEVVVDRIAPETAASDENVVFAVAGGGVPEFDREDVVSAGFVEDLHSFLAAADVAAVPLLRGGGTKLKMFDYMSVGLPIVTTSIGAEGIGLEDGRDALITDDVPGGFVDRILELATDGPRRRELGTNARDLFERRYTWDRIGDRLDECYRGLIDD